MSEEKEHIVESNIPFKLEMKNGMVKCHYNNDLSAQVAAFIMTKSVIDNAIEANMSNPDFKKQKATYLKVSYTLGELIGGLAMELEVRINAQQSKDEFNEMAEKSDIKIVKG